MPRPSFRERVARETAPRGREALYSAPTIDPGRSGDQLPLTVDDQPLVSGPEIPARRIPGERRWEAAHQRVTFYCPRDLLRAVELETARSQRSKSQVIVDALREHLASNA